MPTEPKIESREAGKADAVHDSLRDAICVPIRRYLWVPEDAIEFTPALSNTVYGDGRALLGVTTIHDRPAFWYVRIDSGWRLEMDYGAPRDALDVADVIERIADALLDEFGDGAPDEDDPDPGVQESGWPYPAINLNDGYSWSRKDWPIELGPTVMHPYDRSIDTQAPEVANS